MKDYNFWFLCGAIGLILAIILFFNNKVYIRVNPGLLSLGKSYYISIDKSYISKGYDIVETEHGFDVVIHLEEK